MLFVRQLLDFDLVPPHPFTVPYQRLLRQLRDTRAGKHVVHCYQKHRVPV